MECARVIVMAHIKRVSDGLIATNVSEWGFVVGRPYDTGDALYIWTEGNYACDCNRHIFFERFWDREPDDRECSDGRYLIQLYVDGDLVFDEF
jgi:hypothetical protein